MIGFSILLCFCVFTIECFTPNCVPQNQFINYEFPVEACSGNFQAKCKYHPKGYFKSLGPVTLVKIKEVTVIPTCAFYGTSSLRTIYGVNSNIKVLATKAFVNLPNLKSICLAFNSIVDVQKDVFKNISAEAIDLSWNKIAFIYPHAFKEVDNLKYLNLSKNSLMTLSINNLGKNIVDLNLSNNLIEVLLLNSAFFENLVRINASDNKISKVAISFKYPAEILDLTGNRIENFDYLEINAVDHFKMGDNMFKETPRYLENLNAREIDIYPNPWKCDQLFQLWETLVSFDIRLSKKKKEANPPPECFQSELSSYKNTEKRSTECMDDYDCPTYMACRAAKCWNICEESLCHSSTFCQATDHKFACSCPSNLLSDPLDVHGECRNATCYLDTQCGSDHFCFNEKCIRYGSGSAAGSSSNSGYGALSAGEGYPSVSWDVPSAGYPPATSNDYPYDPRPASRPPMRDQRPYSSTEYPFYPGPVAEESPELPWWFEEIPNVKPSAAISKIPA